MSAPAEPSVTSGGSVVVADDSHLDLPKDAVPMEDIPQSSSAQAQPSQTTQNPPSDDDALKSSSPVATPADSQPAASEQAAPGAEEEPKGKDKDQVPPPPSKERSDSNLAIGPAQDGIGAAASSGADAGLVCNITLLLTSGSRHPYRIDGKYLNRRNVVIPEETEAGLPDPFSISVYTLKELILREWRSDWEAKPASPSSIRLIHFGKLLDDKEQLKKYQFGSESPNVVHMSIRPQDLDEEEPKTGSKHLSTSGGEGTRSRSGGMCCVIL